VPNKYLKLIVVMFVAVSVSACSRDDGDDDAPAAEALPLGPVEKFVASLESTDFSVADDSLDGVWVAVTQTEGVGSWESGDRIATSTWDKVYVEIFALKENPDDDSVYMSSCAGDPETSDGYEYFFDDGRNSFTIEGDQDNNAVIDDLVAPVMAVIESNKKITMSEYMTEYFSEYSVGLNTVTREVNATRVTTMIKVADDFNPGFGVVTVNDTAEDIDCFFHSTGDSSLNVVDGGEETSENVTSSHIRYWTDSGYSVLGGGIYTSGDRLGDEFFDVFVSSFGRVLMLSEARAGVTGSVSFVEEGPIRFSGGVSVTSGFLITRTNEVVYEISLLK